MLQLYSLWHLNLAYSSIEEERHPAVIENCYWPLLNLAIERNIPLGIELPAWTLNKINELDPQWVKALKVQIERNMVELVGSGWTQLIGPLVPAQVVEKNLVLGQEFYCKTLGVMPTIGLVNEQAWSQSLVPIYNKVGFSALVMEWENPASIHSDWQRSWRYFPQLALGGGEKIPLIWNHSIAFQKMQRLAHGEIPLQEWKEWVMSQDQLNEVRSLCIYGSDVETFNFRPGRYQTEEKLTRDEWRIIGGALESIAQDGAAHVLPSKILANQRKPIELCLESPSSPVPVKKQPKYNVVRWASGGRDGPGINSKCFEIYRNMKSRKLATNDEDWRELCELWASDARTHLTQKRWEKFQSRLRLAGEKWTTKPSPISISRDQISSKFEVKRIGRFLNIDSPDINLRLNLRRGMTIDELKFPSVSDHWLVGSLHHGHFDDISWSADFYSWETVLELPGKAKVTDLESCEPDVAEVNGELVISAEIKTSMGPIKKIIRVKALPKPNISLELIFLWQEIPPGSLRMGDLIVNPDFFARDSLFVRTHLGGFDSETHIYPPGVGVEHGKAWSALVSSQYCLGVTEGVIEFGDAKTCLHVEQMPGFCHAPAMVTCLDVADTFIYRIQFTAREIDDTSGAHSIPLGPEGRAYQFTLSLAD
jgi:hypothetical protein